MEDDRCCLMILFLQIYYPSLCWRMMQYVILSRNPSKDRDVAKLQGAGDFFRPLYARAHELLR
jgi:hypothetical protein